MRRLRAGLTRRQWLSGVGALAAGGVTSACKAPSKRDAVLAATVREVVSPVIAAAEIESRSLATLVGRLAPSPASSDLERVRSAWKRTANAWKAASVFRDGPLAASGALSRAVSWPTRRDAVDDLLGSSHPIDSKAVEGLAIDAKGLYAVEYLLFDAEMHELAVTGLAGARGDRARALAAGYSEDVALAARSAADVVNAPESEFATSYAAGGATNLAHLVAQMVESIETFAVRRVGLVLWLDSMSSLHRRDVEGGPSRSSRDLAVALLTVTERLYLGVEGAHAGLSDLVQGAAPRIDRHVRDAFRAAMAAIHALGAPLEEAVIRDRRRLEAVAEALKTLEISLKVEVASALGLDLNLPVLDAD